MFRHPSLKAWYRFNGNSTDSSASGTNGTDTSMTYAAGAIGDGAIFNGSTGKIEVINAVFMNSAAVTFCFYFKATTTTGNLYMMILRNGSNNANYAVQLDNGKITGGPWNGSSSDPVTANSSSSAGVLYHAAVVYNGANSKIFINGVLDKTESASSFTPGSDLYFGANVSSGWYSGMLDDVQIYNVALADTDIMRIAKGLHPLRKY